MMKVIIADDEENICRLIYGLIDWKSLGMEIVGVAHNGVEALDMVKSKSPNLMITDIRMPGYDGLEMIRRAKNIEQDLNCIIISGYRQFEYAQNAIQYGVGDYLLKPIKKDEFLTALVKMKERYRQHTEQLNKEELIRKQMENDAHRLRDNLFTEYLLNKNKSTQDFTVEMINQNFHYLFHPGVFQVYAVKIDCGYEDQYNDAVKILGDRAAQITSRLLKGLCFDMGLYFQDSAVFCVLNYRQEDKNAVKDRIEAVLGELMVQKDDFRQVGFTIGAGTAVEEINRLEDSFQTSCYAVWQRLLEGTNRQIESKTMHTAPREFSVKLAEINKTMGTALEVLDKDAVVKCISDLKKQIVTENLFNGQEIFSLSKHVCNMYLTGLRNNHVEMHHAEEFFEKFTIHADRCGSVDQIFEYLSLMVGESLDLICQDKKQVNAKPIRLAKQYIRENYMNPISLEEVSGFIGFNPTYFSALFKKENGGNFVDYLAETRMNKAKDLLRETNLNIAVICRQVGYNDLKHFTKSFTKVTGIKPNEYRKLYS